MDLAVLIPSHDRPGKLRACLQALGAQTTPPAELLVGLDGGSPADAHRIEHEHRPALPGLRVLALPRSGYIPVRARLLREASAPIALSLNDDVIPSPGLIAAHAHAHARAHERSGRSVVVTGPAPWVTPPTPTLFDQLVAASDLIFFDPARAADEVGRLPYRYCAGLNFSARLADIRAVGGVHDLPATYGYDDVELAFRLTRAGVELHYEPRAILAHDHAYTPLEVERREYNLGRAAWAYRRVSPEFCRELFGRDIADPAEIAFCEQFLRHTRRDAERIERSFLSLGDRPAEPAMPPLIWPLLAEHWTPLKRYLWRWGLLDAARGTPHRFAPLREAPALP